MKRLARGLVITFFVFMVLGLVDSHINAQHKKWIRYHGDFASFEIRWEYQLDFEKNRKHFTYKISDPSFKDKPLIISRGYKKMDFKLVKKADYKKTKEGGLMIAKTGGAEKRGTTPSGNNWREVFIYYACKTKKAARGEFVRVYYDDCPPELSSQYDRIISSIQFKDAYEVPTEMPTMPSNF